MVDPLAAVERLIGFAPSMTGIEEVDPVLKLVYDLSRLTRRYRVLQKLGFVANSQPGTWGYNPIWSVAPGKLWVLKSFASYHAASTSVVMAAVNVGAAGGDAGVAHVGQKFSALDFAILMDIPLGEGDTIGVVVQTTSLDLWNFTALYTEDDV